MQNKNIDAGVLSDTAVNNFQKVANMSVDFYRNIFNTLLENNSSFSNTLTQVSRSTLNPVKSMFNSGDCCPPEQTCPPNCIATIERQAMAGERIIVPFQIKNTCTSPRTYRIGVRELLDLDNKPAPDQPALNKASVTLQPNGSERVLMRLDLANFQNGAYTAEIVVREKEINQNICFTLIVRDHQPPVAEPKEENHYKLRWQSWKSHYYCEPPQKRNN